MPLSGQEAALEPDRPKGPEELMALLNTPVIVASHTRLGIRETPGIVTVVSRDEILQSTARDLLEFLQFVPGFQATYAGQNATALTVRGLSALDGKCLLLIDGVEMNERRYGTLTLDNRFLLDQVQRIEIIRGPGSALYGGFAEFAVINVITRKGYDLQGASAGFSYGVAEGGFLRRTASAAYGGANGDLVWSFAVSGGLGNRTTFSTVRRAAYAYGDATGQQIEFITDIKGRNSSMDGLMFNAGLEWAGLSARVVRNRVRYTDIERAGTPDYPMLETTTLGVDLRYDWILGQSFKVVPHVSYKDDFPWQYRDKPTGIPRRHVYRQLGGLTLVWDPTASLNLQSGFEYYRDKAEDTNDVPDFLKLSNGRKSLAYSNRALFAQGVFRTDLGLFALGARYEAPGLGDASFVPRGAWTFTAGRFHTKLLAAKAYRAPTIQNIDDNLRYSTQVYGSPTITIRPEETTTYECEFGYQFENNLFAKANLFRTHINNTIIFPYKTFFASGTEGMEAELHYVQSWGGVKGTLSLARPRDNEVDLYRVTGREDYLYGAANQKLTLTGHSHLGERLSAGTSWVYVGPRYGYPYHGATAMIRQGGHVLGNVSLDWNRKPGDLRLGLLVTNLLDKRVVQHWGWVPNLTGYDPAPATGGREISLRVSYNY